MKLPLYVKNCIDKLEAAGFCAYAVGGAVRDSILGLEPSDWDVTTSARPDDILRVFEGYRTIPTGIKHGTVTLLAQSGGEFVPIEITTFRIDGEYRDSRHPESVRFSSDIHDDLSRRDFTVNAMAYNEKDGIIDAFGGVGDLERRIIRTVGDPENRFREDALRILRAFRFSSQLGFEIEKETLEGAQACACLLKKIARERIGTEFKKLLSSSGACYALEKMIECGVWAEIFDLPAPKNEVVILLRAISEGSFEARLAVLLSEYEECQINAILDSLRLSNKEKRLVIKLCSIKSFGIRCEDISERARIFLHYYKDALPCASEVLRVYYSGSDEFLRAVEYELAQKRPLSISELALRGEDLLPLCKDDHKQVGLLLKYLLDRVIEDPTLNEKQKLMDIAKKSLI